MTTDEYLAMLLPSALCDPPTIKHTYAMAVDVLKRSIPGDFIECGVFAGAQIAAMHRAMQDVGEYRPIHLYDTFNGIPPAGPFDGEQPGGFVGAAKCSLNHVKENLEQWGVDLSRVYFHEGLLEETSSVNPPQAIALLRLDCDLYEPTRAIMDNLYPRVTAGGIVIVDDFALSGCELAVRNAVPGITPQIVDGTWRVAWWIK